jgi:hypothetical protein
MSYATVLKKPAPTPAPRIQLCLHTYLAPCDRCIVAVQLYASKHHWQVCLHHSKPHRHSFLYVIPASCCEWWCMPEQVYAAARHSYDVD